MGRAVYRGLLCAIAEGRKSWWCGYRLLDGEFQKILVKYCIGRAWRIEVRVARLFRVFYMGIDRS